MQAIQSTLIDEIEQYWTRRASSYSDVVQREQKNGSEKTWMSVITENIPRSRFPRILDIGTGPGFFAIGLARRGYDVTAVDYTEAMLDEARQNAGQLRDSIRGCGQKPGPKKRGKCPCIPMTKECEQYSFILSLAAAK